MCQLAVYVEFYGAVAAAVEVVAEDDDVVPAFWKRLEVVIGGDSCVGVLTDTLELLAILTNLHVGT